MPPELMIVRYWPLETDGSILEVVAVCPCGATYGTCVTDEEFELTDLKI
jgi:hypothetical protein